MMRELNAQQSICSKIRQQFQVKQTDSIVRYNFFSERTTKNLKDYMT